MRSVKRLKVGDKEVSVREADFEIVREDWNEYRLLDGGSVRVKTTVARLFHVLDDDGNVRYNAEGDPEFMVKHSTQVVSST